MPWHGARFNIKTGTVTLDPATEGVARYNLRLSGDDIEVEIVSGNDNIVPSRTPQRA